MAEASFALLDGRGVLHIAGEDRVPFLQGLVSNDVSKVAGDRAVYSAFLTPQGRFLHDFFLIEREGAFLLDCEAARAADLKRRLTLYKLRSKVTLAEATAEWQVFFPPGDGPPAPLGLRSEPRPASAVAAGIAF